MTSLAIDSFDSAIRALGFKPKGVAVGWDLYQKLKRAGRVEQKRALLGGALDIGLDLPCLDGDIFVHIDPDLDDWGYEMPVSS